MSFKTAFRSCLTCVNGIRRAASSSLVLIERIMPMPETWGGREVSNASYSNLIASRISLFNLFRRTAVTLRVALKAIRTLDDRMSPGFSTA